MIQTRSYVLDDGDRFASLHEQWYERVRRRYHRGPDPDEELLAAVDDLRPRTVLAVDGGDIRFCERLVAHVAADVLVCVPGATAGAIAGERGLPAIAATPSALPLADARVDCLVARAPRWRADVVDGVLREAARVISDDGVLIMAAASPDHDGRELDELLGRTPRQSTGAFHSGAVAAALTARFDRVTRTDLDHALVFPTGRDLAGYLRAVPARRRLADGVAGVAGPVRLRYRTSIFVAASPRT